MRGESWLTAFRERIGCVRGTLSRMVRRQVMVLPAIAACAAVVVAAGSSWWLWLLLVLLAALSILGGLRVFALTLLCALVAGFLHHLRLEREVRAVQWHGAQVEWHVVVQDEPRMGRHGREVMVDVQHVFAQEQSMYLHLPWMEQEPEVGDILWVKGKVIEPEHTLNPEAWDEAAWLSVRGVHAVIDASKVEFTGEIAPGYMLKRRSVDARKWAGEKLTAGLDGESEQAKIIRAMFLGERPTGAREMMDDFRESGTIHVFAVSGLHVMMIGGFVAFVLRLFGVPLRVWVCLVIAVMFFYALVTGMRPPAMRAAVMGSIVMGAWLVARRPVLGNSVAIGALVAVLWNGHSLFLPGFQLSFAVLVSIVLTAGFVHRWLKWIQYTDPFLPRPMFTRWQEISLWIRQKVCGGFTVGSSAWLGSSPLMFWHFGIATPVSVLASVPLVFLAFSIMALGCLSLCLASVWPGGGEMVNKVNAYQAGGARLLASTAASAPGGHFSNKEWQDGERVVVYAMPDGGACSYFGLAGGVLLDAGDKDSFYSEVWPSLRNYGAPVDTLIVTHGDSKHCGGFDAVLDLYSVSQALVPDEGNSRGTLKTVLEKIEAQQVRCVRTQQGAKYPLTEESWLEVIYAPGNNDGLADDRCNVFRLHWRERKILFLSDAGFVFEQWAEEQEVDLSADVLVLGKHSRDHSATVDLVKRVAPEVVIASSSAFPEGETRDESWYAQLEKLGVQVYRQESCGAVTIGQDEGVLKVEAYRDRN